MATAKLPPRKPASGRQRGETMRNTAAAAEAARVVWPEGSEFSSSVSTPRYGRTGSRSFRIWVARLAPTQAATAIPAADQRRRRMVTKTTTTDAITTDSAGQPVQQLGGGLARGTAELDGFHEGRFVNELARGGADKEEVGGGQRGDAGERGQHEQRGRALAGGPLRPRLGGRALGDSGQAGPGGAFLPKSHGIKGPIEPCAPPDGPAARTAGPGQVRDSPAMQHPSTVAPCPTFPWTRRPGPVDPVTPPAAALPGLDELLAGAHVVSLPMRVKFRGILQREALLLRGPLGWGEFWPFPEYGDAEASRWLAAAIEAGWAGVPGAAAGQHPGQRHGPCRARATGCPEILARFGRVDAVKVKVAERGQSLDDDAARVAAVREALPDAAIRVDANGGWDVPEAVDGTDPARRRRTRIRRTARAGDRGPRRGPAAAAGRRASPC